MKLEKGQLVLYGVIEEYRDLYTCPGPYFAIVDDIDEEHIYFHKLVYDIHGTPIIGFERVVIEDIWFDNEISTMSIRDFLKKYYFPLDK